MTAAIMFLAGLIIGYFYRDLVETVKNISQSLPRRKTEEEKVEPQSMIIEALTPEQTAKQEFEERVKKLNS